jgi:hypothetical protein
MEIEEMVKLDDGFRIFLFLKERLSSLHDDVGVVVLFDPIAQKNLLVGAAEGFLCGILSLGCAGTGGDDAEHRDTEADGHSKPWCRSQNGGGSYHNCLKT